MSALKDRVAIVTGAGRGIGREHALLLASEGAKVVVNDLAPHTGSGETDVASDVVAEIRSLGGEAVASHQDVTSWEGGRTLVQEAVEAYGDLHVLVNNAGNLRDHMIVTMSEQDWDDVIKVHLKGHFAPLHHAAAYWRERSKSGREVRASVVNTSSTSGLLGNPGQSNYGAAKGGIASLTLIAAQELNRYGIRVNCVAPAARTRMTQQTPGLSDLVRKPGDPEEFDVWDPANVSPLVGYLASDLCLLTGKVFFLQGGEVRLFQPWTMTGTLEKDSRWTIDELHAKLPGIVD